MIYILIRNVKFFNLFCLFNFVFINLFDLNFDLKFDLKFDFEIFIILFNIVYYRIIILYFL